MGSHDLGDLAISIISFFAGFGVRDLVARARALRRNKEGCTDG